MKRLSHTDIKGFVKDFRTFTGGTASNIAQLYALGAEVLINLVGMTWVQNNVFGVAPIDTFLKATSHVTEDRFKHSDRVVSLAEMLFHFQDIDGIEKRIADMMSSSVEDTVGELEGAKFLFRSRIPFRFVVPSGQRGKDFDVQVFGPSGKDINFEMKTKPAETVLSAATIWNTLNNNRDQLPKGRPGVMFMKIPETWICQPEVSEIMGSTLTRFFRGTDRVAAVILHWEEWQFVPGGPAMRIVKFRPEINLSSSFKTIVEDQILQKFSSVATSNNWMYFMSLTHLETGAQQALAADSP
jgi:hypothetical protein